MRGISPTLYIEDLPGQWSSALPTKATAQSTMSDDTHMITAIPPSSLDSDLLWEQTEQPGNLTPLELLLLFTFLLYVHRGRDLWKVGKLRIFFFFCPEQKYLKKNYIIKIITLNYS